MNHQGLSVICVPYNFDSDSFISSADWFSTLKLHSDLPGLKCVYISGDRLWVNIGDKLVTENVLCDVLKPILK
jgi:hypothetical protein